MAGREEYEVTGGEVLFEGKDLLDMKPEERAGEGLFLAFQYPVEIPGVNTQVFLRAAVNGIRKHKGEPEMSAMEFLKAVKEKSKLVELPDNLLKRSVNEGFSGGEKKRSEVFQMALLEPKMSVLDETDSGLDIDALRIVANGVNMQRSPEKVGAGYHALSALAGLHRARFRARFVSGPHHQIGRQRVGAGAGRNRLRRDYR